MELEIDQSRGEHSGRAAGSGIGLEVIGKFEIGLAFSGQPDFSRNSPLDQSVSKSQKIKAHDPGNT